MTWPRFLLVVSWASTAALPAMAQPAPVAHASGSSSPPRVTQGDIPLSFEPNMGQERPEVRYLARGNRYTLYLADTEMLLRGSNGAPLNMRFVGASRASRMVGEARQASVSNYLIGNDPSKWRTGVPNYGSVRYRDAYPGIDLVFYGHDGADVEYDWTVSPSADPGRIRLRFDHAARMRVDRKGDLVVELGEAEYRQKKPVAYQEIGGKRVEVAAAWRLRGTEAGFRIGRYDRTQPLIIDPALYYSTYLGGTASDYAYAVAVDVIGNTYVTGGTASTNFPTTNPLQGSLRGSNDVFVTKINAAGTARVYSTFLGSGGVDEGRGIAVNSLGEVYVTGSAGFSDFPTKNAIQATWGGSGDAFLTKLDSTGSSLVYSTYLGGNAVDYGTAIALDPAGNAYVTGVTFSTNFPTVNPFQSAKGLQQDAFVAKMNPSGSAYVYVTYLGGNNVDEAYGIAVDPSGNAYLTGWTQSTNFPLASPFQSTNHGAVDGFVTKLNPAGSALVYSTYLGGTGNDNGNAIAVDSSGSAYVTGVTASEDFPVANAIDSTLGSHAVDDVFIAKVNPAGSALNTEKEEFEKTVPTAMVMAEMKKPRDTFVLARGDYRNPTEKVQPGVPAMLPPLPKDAPRNRLTLARWLVDPNHPLTARVAVNRFWQMYFGTGIVKTQEDFGVQGEPPVHPELLDWLATEFVRTGWDIRAMQRLIVTSATYRQSSSETATLRERDPDNRLLARASRFRFPAETIRDTALAASGLLNREIGGPSVLPYQPKGLWEEMAFGEGFSGQAYEQSIGKDLYRRGMYTLWKRTVPPASLSIFDAPDRDKCTARRAVTNTPLQALTLMNDPTYVEAARALAQRALLEGGKEDKSRIVYAFRLATARTPTAKEVGVLRDLLKGRRISFAADRRSAVKLLDVGESGRNSRLDASELAAWTTVASVILNLDETITRQ